MCAASQQTIYLQDYTPPEYLIDIVELTFRLSPGATRVLSRISFRPNPAAISTQFKLHGDDLTLIEARIDGQPVTPTITDTGLTCDVPNTPFIWEAEVEIAPQDNTALEGLYMSNGMYCTQCEAEGFRKITFYPDRPDVLATFKVRIESDLPVLLSNGNPTAQGEGWAEWHDPWPKPSYLFALVAGDLVNHPDRFTTMSGREVELNIWVRSGDEGKCAFGMQALKQSMQWDEQVYGREYDLDLFNIVAVDDFNAGAMENKGLNIFNSSCVLASPETSTDGNFERIESIIAHEYFHNWTGNRITCRDWFQLCLKEGLTVFRDQQFTADVRSAAVARIDSVLALRGRQFREDNGPLAHPVRPESFVEINNFYTATVYEKGAEVIGMLRRLVGPEGYAKALDLYFDRHDGQAATIEDWLQVFQDATGRDLTQFKRWYSQAGTPRLSYTETFEGGDYTLTFTQTTPPTPGQPDKAPQVVPIAVGLLDQDGDELMPTTILEMTEGTQSFRFSYEAAAGESAHKPIPSVLREFSAPVILTTQPDRATQAFLLAHDTDPFNKWEAGRSLSRDVLIEMTVNDTPAATDLLDALAAVARDDTLDPAFRALALNMPGQEDMAQALSDAGHVPDPTAIHHAIETLKLSIATHLQDLWPRLYAGMTQSAPYAPTADQAGQRALRGRALGYLSRLDGGAAAQQQFETATNMTDELTAFSALIKVDRADAAVPAFEAKWQHDRLVMDKWFNLQIVEADPAKSVQIAQTLTQHSAFDIGNPNRFRSVMGGLIVNAAGFHAADGTGYEFLADWLIKLDAKNPQTAARMCTAFEAWRRYDTNRQTRQRAAMQRIRDIDTLSGDTTEMINRLLA